MADLWIPLVAPSSITNTTTAGLAVSGTSGGVIVPADYVFTMGTRVEVRLCSFLRGDVDETIEINLGYQRADITVEDIVATRIRASSGAMAVWQQVFSPFIDVTDFARRGALAFLLRGRVSGGTGNIARPTLLLRLT